MLSLLLTLALAQPVGTPCATGRNCRLGDVTARSFRATSSSATITQACYQNNTNALVLRRNSQYLEFGVAASCSAGLTSFPLYLDTTSLRTGLGSSVSLVFDGFATPTALGTPTVKAITADVATNRLWKSNASKWTEIGGAPHPVSEAITYLIVSDRTASFPPAWAVAPRAGGASVAFASAGTLTSGTTFFSEPFTNYATTAVSGNQAHHSTAAVYLAPSNRWTARVGFGALGSLTSTRAFFGLSSALPLAAGSSTPTADAAVFRVDTTVNGNWWACTSDGSAAISCTDTGVAVAFTAEINHELAVDCREASGLGLLTACTFWIDGIPRTRRTTSLPNSSVGTTVSVETLTAASRSFYFSTQAIEPSVRPTP